MTLDSTAETQRYQRLHTRLHRTLLTAEIATATPCVAVVLAVTAGHAYLLVTTAGLLWLVVAVCTGLVAGAGLRAGIEAPRAWTSYRNWRGQQLDELLVRLADPTQHPAWLRHGRRPLRWLGRCAVRPLRWATRLVSHHKMGDTGVAVVPAEADDRRSSAEGGTGHIDQGRRGPKGRGGLGRYGRDGTAAEGGRQSQGATTGPARDRGRFVTANPAERFWSKVDRNGPVHERLGTPCWLWTAGLDDDGYGRFRRTVAPGRYRDLKAHRVAWEAEHGPIPDDLTLDHLCRNTACVRPDHLEPVPLAENIRRAHQHRAGTTTGQEATP